MAEGERSIEKSTNTAPSRQPFTSADIPILDDGRIYHLHLRPEQLASDILIVGDPGRATFIADRFFKEVQVSVEHRGLRSITGITRMEGHRVSIITSGMGTPSLEIVLQELSILKHVDFKTRMFQPLTEPLCIIRVGTSGALQTSTPLGTAIISHYAVGMDNTGMFYEGPVSDQICQQLELELHEYLKQHTPASSRFYGRIWPYVTKGDSGLTAHLTTAATERNHPFLGGITVSNSGFFASQGRDISTMPPTIRDIDLLLSQFDPKLGSYRVENMEMETSALFHLGGGQGFKTASICPAIANRRLETVARDIETHVAHAAEISLHSLWTHRKSLALGE